MIGHHAAPVMTVVMIGHQTQIVQAGDRHGQMTRSALQTQIRHGRPVIIVTMNIKIKAHLHVDTFFIATRVHI